MANIQIQSVKSSEASAEVTKTTAQALKNLIDKLDKLITGELPTIIEISSSNALKSSIEFSNNTTTINEQLRYQLNQLDLAKNEFTKILNQVKLGFDLKYINEVSSLVQESLNKSKQVEVLIKSLSDHTKSNHTDNLTFEKRNLDRFVDTKNMITECSNKIDTKTKSLEVKIANLESKSTNQLQSLTQKQEVLNKELNIRLDQIITQIVENKEGIIKLGEEAKSHLNATEKSRKATEIKLIILMLLAGSSLVISIISILR